MSSCADLPLAAGRILSDRSLDCEPDLVPPTTPLLIPQTNLSSGLQTAG